MTCHSQQSTQREAVFTFFIATSNAMSTLLVPSAHIKNPMKAKDYMFGNYVFKLW